MVAQALAAGYRPAFVFFTAQYAAGYGAGYSAGAAAGYGEGGAEYGADAAGYGGDGGDCDEPDEPTGTDEYGAGYSAGAAGEEARALLAELAAGDTALWQVSPEVMQALADTVTPQGIAAVVPMAAPDVARAREAGLLLILDNLRDPGNLGTVLRTARAAGVEAVALSAGCVDLYAPKVVRAGMGAHFRLAVLPGLAWAEIASLATGRQVLLADARGELTPWQVNWRQPTALIIGNEAHGASPEARALAPCGVRLPMEADMESLNAAIAAAVFMFEAQRQRRWADHAPADR